MDDQDRMVKAVAAAAIAQARDEQTQRASSMVAVQSKRAVDAALILMAEFATTHDRSIDDVVNDVVGLRLRFDVTGDSHRSTERGAARSGDT